MLFIVFKRILIVSVFKLSISSINFKSLLPLPLTNDRNVANQWSVSKAERRDIFRYLWYSLPSKSLYPSAILAPMEETEENSCPAIVLKGDFWGKLSIAWAVFMIACWFFCQAILVRYPSFKPFPCSLFSLLPLTLQLKEFCREIVLSVELSLWLPADSSARQCFVCIPAPSSSPPPYSLLPCTLQFRDPGLWVELPYLLPGNALPCSPFPLFPLTLQLMVSREGFEPSTHALKGRCSTNWASGPYFKLNSITKSHPNFHFSRK